MVLLFLGIVEIVEKEKKMVKKRITIVELIIFSVVFFIAATLLKDEYLFGWITKNWTFYLSLSLLALILQAKGKKHLSIWMSGGIVFGVFIGNYLGKWIMLDNIERITQSMDAQEVAMLNQNPGFIIWLVVILISMGIGIINQIILKRKKTITSK